MRLVHFANHSTNHGNIEDKYNIDPDVYRFVSAMIFWVRSREFLPVKGKWFLLSCYAFIGQQYAAQDANVEH